MPQKYKLYINYAIVHCTKWKIFSLSTARNGKFSASPLHEMEIFNLSTARNGKFLASPLHEMENF